MYIPELDALALRECEKADLEIEYKFPDLFGGRYPEIQRKEDKKVLKDKCFTRDAFQTEFTRQIIYEEFDENDLAFFKSMYSHAMGLVSIRSNYNPATPVFTKANFLGHYPKIAFGESTSNCVNRRISLSTFKLEKKKTPTGKMEDIEQVCALAVEIASFTDTFLNCNFVMDAIDWEKVEVPKPSFVYDVAEKVCMIWTFKKPIWVPKIKKERTAVLNLLDKTVHVIAKKLSAVSDKFFAKAIKLNGSILAPGSLFISYYQTSVNKEELYPSEECYTPELREKIKAATRPIEYMYNNGRLEKIKSSESENEERIDLNVRRYKKMPKLQVGQNVRNVQCATSDGRFVFLDTNKNPECVDDELVSYVINRRKTFGSVVYYKTGALFAMRDLTGKVLPPVEMWEEMKTEKEKKKPFISLKHSKFGSNIADMLYNRMSFIKKIVHFPSVYNSAERMEECLKQFWIAANQFYKDQVLAYEQLKKLFNSLNIKLTMNGRTLDDRLEWLNNLIKTVKYDYNRTHAHFLKKLGFSISAAIKAGFKMQTKEDRKAYQKEYQKRYYLKKKAEKYKKLRCKNNHEVILKRVKRVKALFAKGNSIEKIAKKVGKTTRTIKRYLNMDIEAVAAVNPI